jgi:hypothetical protein
MCAAITVCKLEYSFWHVLIDMYAAIPRPCDIIDSPHLLLRFTTSWLQAASSYVGAAELEERMGMDSD